MRVGSGLAGHGSRQRGFEAIFGAVEEGWEFGEALLEFGELVGLDGDVTEFAAGTRGFAVEVQVRVWHFEQRGDGRQFFD